MKKAIAILEVFLILGCGPLFAADTKSTINSLTGKTTPASTDKVPIWSVADSATQAFTLGNLAEWRTTNPSANGLSLVSADDYAAMRGLLDLEAGTDFNAYDADLTTWAGITPGTGVGTALAVNVGSAGSFVTNGGALGTPSSGTLTNCTFPTLNQNTTGSAASLSISGQSGRLSFTGLTSSNRTKTVRDAADTILELGGSYTPTGTWNLGSATITNAPTWNQNTTGTAAGLSATLSPTTGGTGVANNAANTITFSGNYGLTLTLTGTTGITLPTSGTLATTSQLHSAATIASGIGAITINGQELSVSPIIEALSDLSNASGVLTNNGSGGLSWGAGGGGGATAWDDIGDPDAAGSIAFAGYQQTMTSTLNSAGSVFTYTNTTADLTADVSFMDFKYTDDGDANGYFLRGYDNSGNDLKWSIGVNGDITTAGTITAGGFVVPKTSGVAGVSRLYEANSTDTDTVGWMGPISLSTSWDYQLSGTAPSDNSIMLFSAPSSAVSTQSWINLSAVPLSITFNDGEGDSPYLQFMDGGYDNATFSKLNGGYLTLEAAANRGLNIRTGNLMVGDGTPSLTLNGEDCYIEGTLEVDGAANLDGAVTLGGGLTLGGDITQTAGAYDWDMIDNNASALSFDAPGKSGILEIVTTDSAEGVKMSGTLAVTGALSAASITTTASTAPVMIFGDSDAPGTDKEIAKLSGNYIDGADGAENGTLDLNVHEAGTTTSYVQLDGKNTDVEIKKALVCESTVGVATSLNPDTAGGATFGTTSLEWGNSYWTDAVVLYFGADQDVSLTHVADTGLLLNAAMQLQFRDSAVYVASLNDGYLDIEADTAIRLNGPVETGSNSFTANGACTIGDGGDDIKIKLQKNTSDGTWNGITMNLTAHENVAFGQLVFINSDGEAALADADAAASMPAVAIVVVAANAGATCTVLTHGVVSETDWAFTAGSRLYVSESGGSIEATLSNISDTNDVVQIIGVALGGDTILFNPSLAEVVLE